MTSKTNLKLKEISDTSVLLDLEEGKKGKAASIFSNFKNAHPILAKHFNHITNKHEFLKIAQAYYDDFKAGDKHFAFVSTEFLSSQQVTVLALTSYFDHCFPLKMAIVTGKISSPQMKELTQDGVELEQMIPVFPVKNMKVNRLGDNIDLIDINDLKTLAKDGVANTEYEQSVEKALSVYDVVFFDMPEMKDFNQHKVLYYAITQNIDTLSIIVTQGVSKTQDITELRDVYTAHGIDVKGVIFDCTSAARSKKTFFNF